MRIARGRLAGIDLTLPLVGAAATLIASFAAAHLSLKLGLGAVVATAAFLAMMLAYLRAPHWAVAVTVVLFPVVPFLKVFVNSNIGAVKDLVDLAAITAGLIIVAIEHRLPDRWGRRIGLPPPGDLPDQPRHPHDAAWAQGIRLVGEPLLLLIVGSVLPNPRRNLRYGLGALVAVATFIAFYGIVQQLLGPARLVSLGYSYSAQVRTIGSNLRSFGTLDDPFEYAAVLLLGLGAIFFWMRRGSLAWGAAALMLLGLLASFVRTGVLVLVGYGALELIRRRRLVPATFFLAGAIVAASLTLVKASGTQTTTVTFYPANGTVESVSAPVYGGENVFLNGRLSGVVDRPG